MTEFFWEDVQQAVERIQGCFVLYGNTPVYVELIEPDENGVPYAHLRTYPKGTRSKVILADREFHRFRKLPVLGWINNERRGNAILLERRIVRQRRHGLGNDNVNAGYISRGYEIVWRDIDFTSTAKDQGYVDANAGNYPKLEEVLDVLREDSTIAVSPLFAVHRDDLGVRWLYRYHSRVGLFPDNNSLLLMKGFGYLREEINAAEELPIETIREF